MVFESAAVFMNASPSIEDVEREIQFHLDFIRTIQGYRNARLLSISRLPSDVLSTIFEHLALFTSPTHPFSPAYSTWLPATQVCRGWREIALDTPRMWSCIHGNTSPEFVELLLQRSKSVSLHIRSLRNYDPARSFVIPLVVQHAHRLAEIDIPYSSATNCPLYLDSSFFRNLRKLKLEASGGRTEPVVDVLLALRKMEQLETLELVHVLRRSGTIPDGITAVLLCLTSVCITTHHIDTLLILRHISCPNVQFIHAQCDAVAEPDELAPVASAFYSLLPILNPSAWRTMLVSRPTPSRCHARMAIWSQMPGSGMLSPHPPFELSVEGAPNFQNDLTLCSTLPTTAPEVLSFHSGGDVTPAALQFLRALDNVQQALFSDIQDIFTVLRDTPTGVGDDGKLPSFSLSSLDQLYWSQVKSISKEQVLATLVQMLSTRQAIGASIKCLVINNSYMQLSESDVAPLRSCVGKLILDYYELYGEGN